MEIDAAGHVLTEATVENLADLYAADRRILPPQQVRRITVPDARVDTSAALLSLPTRLIRQLGLKRRGTRQVTTSAGPAEAAMYDPVRLTIQGRTCTMDVLQVPDECPVLIGHIPLTHLDLVIDTRSRTLIGNPAHGGEHIYEMY